MERDYIDQLNRAYENFFGDDHQGSPVLKIDTNDLNYIANRDDLKWVKNRIQQTLKRLPIRSLCP